MGRARSRGKASTGLRRSAYGVADQFAALFGVGRGLPPAERAVAATGAGDLLYASLNPDIATRYPVEPTPRAIREAEVSGLVAPDPETFARRSAILADE